MKKTPLNIIFSALAVISASLFLSPIASAGLIFFDDRAAFEAASGLSGVNEDFEQANVAPGGVGGTTNPLNAFTDDNLFSTGEIVSGLNIGASNGAVVALGAGVVGDSIGVGADLFSASTSIFFDTGYTAIGLDLYVATSSDTVDITMFNMHGAEIASTAVSGISRSLSFFGVISDGELITKIDFNSQSGAGEIIDNVTFENATVDIPEPSSIALLVLSFAGLSFSRRKK